MANLKLSSLTREYVRVKVRATLNGVYRDISGTTVELTYKDGDALPDSADWQAGDWEIDPTGEEPVYYARRIFSPWPADGTWTVWVRITDAPEVVVRRCTNKLVIEL